MAGFEPKWGGVFENWTKAYMRVHHWRVRHELDFADAVQEGARIFSWCLRKTTSQGGRIDNEKWFMRYYQRAVATWLIDKAARSTARREGQSLLAQQHHATAVEQDGPLLATLSKDASRDLQIVLRVIAASPSEFFTRLLLHRSPDIDWSRRLSRLCNIPINETIIGELRRLLKE